MIPPEPEDTGGFAWWEGKRGAYVEAECYLCRDFAIIPQGGNSMARTQSEAVAWLDAHRCAEVAA